MIWGELIVAIISKASSPPVLFSEGAYFLMGKRRPWLALDFSGGPRIQKSLDVLV